MADVTTGLYMRSARWLLLLMSIVFSLAMIPLLFGDHQSKIAGLIRSGSIQIGSFGRRWPPI
jgi:hypothetical protein